MNEDAATVLRLGSVFLAGVTVAMTLVIAVRYVTRHRPGRMRRHVVGATLAQWSIAALVMDGGIQAIGAPMRWQAVARFSAMALGVYGQWQLFQQTERIDRSG